MGIEEVVQNTVDKLKQFENNHHIEFQKEILDELLTLKTCLLKELAEADVLPVNDEKTRKADYQLMHLKNSYSQLQEKYDTQKQQLEQENENLRRKIAELSKQITYQINSSKYYIKIFYIFSNVF